jgi:AcrR family transcriptional regulator
MTDETKRKILEAALKLFSEKGYGGATTKIIALNAGFTEMTLYTKFKNKQNLFDQVMIHGIATMKEDASSILFTDNEFESPEEFLESYVRDLVKFVWNNLAFFRIVFNQNRKVVGPILKENVMEISKHIEKHIPNQNIDYPAFTLSIFSFVYMYNIGMCLGHYDSSRDAMLDNYINNLKIFIQ